MKRFFYYGSLLVFFVASSVLLKDVYDFSRILESYGYSSLPDKTEKIDLIVVLTGGQGRFKAGVELMQLYPQSILLVSGAETFVTLDDVLIANSMSDLDDSLRSRIWLGQFSKNTEENAVEVREVAERVRAKQLLLVTSSYHIRRAWQHLNREFSRESQEIEVSLHYYPVESPNFPRDGWWKKKVGWQIFFSEYLKSISLEKLSGEG